jgi:hypothetical protein
MLIQIVICFIAFSGCSSQENEINLDDLEPDMEDRYKVNEKQDANSPVFRTNDFLSNSYPLDLQVVFTTASFEVMSAGIFYSITYDDATEHPTEWTKAWANQIGRDENGRKIHSVTVSLQPENHYRPGFVRYAVFAMDAGALVTYWDNNKGGDYFVFFNKTQSPLIDFQYQKDNGEVTLDLYTTNMGMESVTVVYSLNNWENTQEAATRWIEGANIEHWQATIPFDSGDKELVFALSIYVDGSTLWANNYGHDYHVGLVDLEPTEVLFSQDDFTVDGELGAGGFFKIIYDREALCLTCYQGMCSKSIELQYRFYEDIAFWKHQLHKEVDNDYCGEPDCPPVMASDPIYIPLDTENLSVWFLHTGGRPPCSAWDSNQGNDYNLGRPL